MATYNAIKFDPYKPPEEISLDECDICGSSQIIPSLDGYVCQDCGVVLEVKRFEYHKPYDAIKLQHAVIGKTQIGFKHERRVMNNSVHMEYLHKLDSARDGEEMVKIAARVEIRRLLTGLDFPLQDMEVIFKKFTEVRSQLGKGTKYRSPEKLVPCIIYFHYKANNRPIREAKLLEIAHISKKDFNNFKLQLLEMWPNYQERNRQEYILQRLLGLCEHFNLGMNFYHQTKKVLYRFYDSIKNTKDDVIVGLVSSITLLCSDNQLIRVSNICDRLNIKMSTIQTQVERRIFEQFHIINYTSLIRSKVILKRIMIKLGILDPQLIEFEQEEEFNSESVLESESEGSEELWRLIALGSAQPVFNAHDNKEYYVNVLKIATKHEMMVALVVKPKNLSNVPVQRCGNGKIGKKEQDEAVRVELWKFQYPTGPPLIAI